jgi:sirohydrochlorin ferrochelatase
MSQVCTTKTKSLLLIAHGSRRAASNMEVQALTERLAYRVADRFSHVRCAFLEFAQPSIPEAIDAAVLMGDSEIVVLPYFLACGNHVSQDIPEIIAAKRAQHASVRIELKPYVGTSPAMLDLLACSV